MAAIGFYEHEPEQLSKRTSPPRGGRPYQAARGLGAVLKRLAHRILALAEVDSGVWGRA